MPVVGPYLEEFQGWLTEQGFRGGLLIMLSNGGVVSAEVAARNPIRMVESGPAAGALAGAWYARQLGLDRLLCFDMGGTTAKSCLIEHEEPELTTDFEIARMYRFKKGSGFPVTVPSIDLVEIGAGGGSISRVDELGLLKVGPVRIDLARSYVRKLDDVGQEEREALLDEMRNEGRAVLSSAGVPDEDVTFRYGIDARYSGQGNEITIWLGEGDAFPAELDTVRGEFATLYEAVYGMTIPDVAIEVVTWRISTFARAPHVSLAARTSSEKPRQKGTRAVRFERHSDPVPTPVFDRTTLAAGVRIDGPALLEERETTAVLRPGWSATVDEYGSIIAEPS